MKKILLLIIIAPIISFSQIKKDNTIIINDKIQNSKIKEVLFMNGYSVSNNDSLYIVTDPKGLSKWAYSIKIMVMVKDSITYIKGQGKSDVTMGLLEDSFNTLYYGGVKNSAVRGSWEELDRIAKLISNKISYTKQ